MPFDDHPPPPPADLTPSERANWTMDQAMANITRHCDGVAATEVEVYNRETNGLLKLPQEILEMIYKHVYEGQVLELRLSASGQARLASASVRHPFALPGTCRKLRHDTAEYPYSKPTFRFATYKFMSMLGSRAVAIIHNPNPFLDCLEWVTTERCIEFFEVIGVQDYSGEGWAKNVGPVLGHETGVDYKVKLEGFIREVFPEANITFRTAEDNGRF